MFCIGCELQVLPSPWKEYRVLWIEDRALLIEGGSFYRMYGSFGLNIGL